MNLPNDCLYTPADQWLRREGDVLTIGITEYGQNELGELVLVELPEAGTNVRAGASFGVVESVKSVSELVSPIAGKVVSSNEAVAGEPTLVNDSPFEEGWLVRIAIEGELPTGLMSPAAYAAFRKL
ncbi:glycine cleavage system protein GcvH [bacterium]|nr:MAG: glycine cleavage system protein GcvH [bacterium]